MIIDYILKVVLGCTTCLLGFEKDFYCGTYCIFGKIILGLTPVLFIFIIFPDIKANFNSKLNGTTTKK
jgi:hypothetical protein